MGRLTVLLALIPLAGCAARARDLPPGQTETTMPNPTGCFVQVWDRPRFEGVFDYINGPRDYPSLRDLPGGRVWRNRIWSAKVGPDATVVLFTDENGEGNMATLRADQEYRNLPDALAGKAQSASVRCSTAQTPAAE